MIESLEGKVISIRPFYLHLQVLGIGYRIQTPLNVLEYIEHKKIQTLFLYIRTIYREDGQTLYGFLQEAEAFLFDFLCSLNGIGPKIAMNIISALGSSQTLFSLTQNSIKILEKVPGVGSKKAEKILFEASIKKNKLKELFNVLEKVGYNIESQIKEDSTKVSTDFNTVIEEALLSLGFKNKEIMIARGKIAKSQVEIPLDKKENLSYWIKLYLKYL